MSARENSNSYANARRQKNWTQIIKGFQTERKNYMMSFI